MRLDTVIANGRWFDGTGGPSAVRHLGIRDGRLVAVSTEPLPVQGADVVDAAGQWVVPGFVDIHTHYDAEVLLGPGLGESVRHGVTTVVFGSCSLGTVHVGPLDAADLFSRVEAVPREYVLAAMEDGKSWSNAQEYVEALESLALGPNVATFLGHSDLRAGVMGLDRSTDPTCRPTARELDRMEQLLVEALDAGMLGLSEMRNPWDKLDGDRFRSRTLPSTFATRSERRRLHGVLRRRGRVLQSIPNLAKPVEVLPALLESVGRRGAEPLRTSFLTAADVKSNPFTHRIFGPLARWTNRAGGAFRWQHLPVPFEVFADGMDLVIFEEFGAGAAALHLREGAERDELLADEAYRQWFRRQYDQKLTPRVWNRNFHDARIVACPDPTVVDRTFGQIADARGVHPVDAFLDLVVEHGSELRWTTVVSNHRPAVLDHLSALPEVQIGFSDAGAHLRNMAFYNFPLRLLRRANDSGFMSIEQAVHRVTGELGTWFGMDAGHLRVGDRADLVIIDPEHLDESVDRILEAPAEAFGGRARLVNRNDDAVVATYVAGTRLYGSGEFTADFGTRRTGRYLRAGETPEAVDPHQRVAAEPVAG